MSMSNPSTIDRRDIAHTTNPIGGQGHIEEIRATTAEAQQTGSGRLDLHQAEGRKPVPLHRSRSAH